MRSTGTESDASESAASPENFRTGARPDPDTRTVRRRRIGRDGLLEAAADLLTTVRLRDVLGWVGIRAVADKANVAPATVNHHFPPTAARSGEPNAALARALVDHLVNRIDDGTDVAAGTVRDGVDGMAGHPPESLKEVANLVASEMLRAAPPTDDAEAIAKLLAAAVARNDPDAARPLKEHYDHLLAAFKEVYAHTLEVTGRRLRAGIDLETLAVSLTALDDGYSMRARFDPDIATAERFGTAGVHLFEAFTVAVDDPEDTDPASSLIPRTVAPPLTEEMAAQIVAASIRRYRGAGWKGVSITSVAAESGVSQHTIAAHYGTRNALAALIWTSFIPQLQAGLDADADQRIDRIIHNHMYRVADLAQHHRRVSEAMISAGWNRTILGRRPAPPERIRLITMLVPVLEQHKASFRPGMVDTPELAAEMAGSLSTSPLTMALARPNRTAGEIADRLCSTVLAGALVRRPRLH